MVFSKGLHSASVTFSTGFNKLDSGIKNEEENEECYLDQNELIQKMNMKNLELAADCQEVNEKYQRMKKVNEGLMQQLYQKEGDKSEMELDNSMAKSTEISHFSPTSKASKSPKKRLSKDDNQNIHSLYQDLYIADFESQITQLKEKLKTSV